MIHGDRKYPAEYTSAENCIEMQVSDRNSYVIIIDQLLYFNEHV